MSEFNVNGIRKDFPFFENNPSLAYLDNGATSQRPKCVLEAINEFYFKYNANPFRGLYDISVIATDTYNLL